MFKKLSWEDLWLWLAYMVVIAGVVLVGVVAFAHRKTTRYTLGMNKGTLTITKEIDWCIDDEIPLDRSVTYMEAIHLVDSLNKTLK